MLTDITTLKSNTPGPTLAVFAGVHGNELAGVQALRNVIKSTKLSSGTVHFVIANPKAVEKNIRFIEKNLNRCFIKGNSGQTYEDPLAVELMRLIDGCDALLDLHGYNGEEDRPFLICEPGSFNLASKLDFSIVSSGWSATEPGGTDGYMDAQGKIAVCAECGSNFHHEKYVALAEKTIKQFLATLGVLDESVSFDQRQQTHVQVKRMIKKKTNHFSFSRKYQNFDPLVAGEVFATDGETEYRAEANECIIFPRPNTEIGQEACVIGSLRI